MTIVPNRDEQYEITCVFAPGSQSKGCRIVIMPERGGGDCELNITARRPEGGGESVVNVDLPAAGEYSLVVYDDELVTQENPALTTYLSIPGPTPEAGIQCLDYSALPVHCANLQGVCLIWKVNRPVTMKRSTVGLKFSVLFFVPSIMLLLCVVALVTGIVIAVAVISGSLFVASLIITRKCRGTGTLFVSLCFH